MKGYCPFKKFGGVFGEVNKGVHAYKPLGLGVAIVDFVLSILMSILITATTKVPLVLTVILVLVLGEFLHMLFGVNTNTIKYLGLKC